MTGIRTYYCAASSRSLAVLVAIFVTSTYALDYLWLQFRAVPRGPVLELD